MPIYIHDMTSVDVTTLEILHAPELLTVDIIRYIERVKDASQTIQ